MRIITSWKWAVQWAGVLSVCLGLIACSSGGSSSSGGTPQVSNGSTTTGTVTAAAGGTIMVTDPTSPIAGATVTVPAGAIAAGSVQISITHQDNLPGPLRPEAVAAGAVFVSKTIVLTKDRPGTFDQPIQITVPYAAKTLDPEDVPSVLYWNEATNHYEAVTVTDFNPVAGTVTFHTAHFSSFSAVAIPGLGKRLASDPSSSLLGGYTGFLPSFDGFFRENFGSYYDPHGNCLGLSYYVEWFFDNAKDSLKEGPLEPKFQQPLPSLDNDIVAQELIVRAHAASSQQWAGDQVTKYTNLGQFQTGVLLIQALQTTGQPLVFLMYSNPTWWQKYVLGKSSWGHALVVYRYSPSDQTFYLYDSNQPLNNSFGVRFDGSGFTGLTTLSPYSTEPDLFGFVSYHDGYSYQNMKDLLDGAKAGWNEGQFGKITITTPNLSLDSTGRAATVPAPDNIHLTGYVTPSGDSAGHEPNMMDVYVNGRKTLGSPYQITSNSFSFDIPLPTPLPIVPGQTSTEVLMVAYRQGLSDVGVHTASIYGTFRRFKISVSQGTWSATGSLIEGRRGLHTATLLPNGTVLVAGGLGNNATDSNRLASAELYDPITGTWTSTGSLIEGRGLHTATLLPNGTVLVAGGLGNNATDSNRLASAELYDPTTGTWTSTGSLSGVRFEHSAMLLPTGKVLVFGGYRADASGHGIYGTLGELYDPATGTWTSTGSMSFGRSSYTATLLSNGKVLVAGGTNGSTGVLALAELYDPATGTWTITGSMLHHRYTHTATLLSNGKVLVAGGNTGGGIFASAELYDPVTGKWTNTGDMTQGYYGSTLMLLPTGKVLAAGGYTDDRIYPIPFLASAILYDPATGTWASTGSMSKGRNHTTATLLLDGKVLVFGGYLNDSSTARLDTSAELYTP